ncbi:MAG: tetratricopeptide repeat protein, partial [Bryobacteraceae bacterium]|nr:tetratricopeptide repeat protein [Bryobacteraceae bacterium]
VHRFLKFLKIRMLSRGYEYWVGLALSEDDLTIKVEYLSKALKLNPTYMAAWGMKGNALLELARYEEAIECFDKCIEVSPSGTTWYKRALCCDHLKKREEAIRCLRKAMEGSQDRQLLEDASRMRKLLEDDSPSEEPLRLATNGGDSQGLQDAPGAHDGRAVSQCGMSVHTTASPSSAVHADNDVILVM